MLLLAHFFLLMISILFRDSQILWPQIVFEVPSHCWLIKPMMKEKPSTSHICCYWGKRKGTMTNEISDIISQRLYFPSIEVNASVYMILWVSAYDCTPIILYCHCWRKGIHSLNHKSWFKKASKHMLANWSKSFLKMVLCRKVWV